LKSVECSEASTQHSEAFLFRQNDEIHSEHFPESQVKSSHETKNKYRPLYRIVSSPIEPFVITSQLDEDFISKNECKDGLLCLDIKSNLVLDQEDEGSIEEENNVTLAVKSVLNRELTVGLIKGFKYISDFKNSNEDKVRSNEKKLVKYKCCTG
jgi:hypothetical protein